MYYRIIPPEEFPEGRLRLPLSKSISNRALMLNALSPRPAAIEAVAECDDTRVMAEALEPGCATTRTVDVGAAGTSMRFLTAYFASLPDCHITLDGSERMRSRPIRPLVDALRAAGADIEYAGDEGFPPLLIHGRSLHGGSIAIDPGISSQYISALLMVAPLMEQGMELTLDGETVSAPYIRMTLGMMRLWGADVEADGPVITVKPGPYSAPDAFTVEADWSAASYWYETVALSAGDISLEGLSADSLQGDAATARIFAKMGALSEWNDDGVLELLPSPDADSRHHIDLTDNPDLAQTLAVTCCLLGYPFVFTGLQTLRIKETDRLEALVAELRKLSFVTYASPDGSSLEWDGTRCPVATPVVVDTYDDHRMAMAFAPASLYIPGLIIAHPEVVTKSYPEFWAHMRQCGFQIEKMEAAPCPE